MDNWERLMDIATDSQRACRLAHSRATRMARNGSHPDDVRDAIGRAVTAYEAMLIDECNVASACHDMITSPVPDLSGAMKMLEQAYEGEEPQATS